MSDVAPRPSRPTRRPAPAPAPATTASTPPPPSPSPAKAPSSAAPRRRPSAAPPASDDRTSPDLLSLPDADFAREMDRRLGLGALGRAGPWEEEASEEVLLPRVRGKAEEEALHTRIMASLRARVLALERADDPSFDPLCPAPEQDLTGLADDPLLLLRLASLAHQDPHAAALRTGPIPTEIPEKL